MQFSWVITPSYFTIQIDFPDLLNLTLKADKVLCLCLKTEVILVPRTLPNLDNMQEAQDAGGRLVLVLATSVAYGHCENTAS